MNILFTNNLPFNPTLGGIERVTDTIARALIAGGHYVFFLANTRCSGGECDFAGKQFFMPSGELYATPDDIRFYGQLLKDHKIDVVVNQRGSYSFGNFVFDTSGVDVRIVSVIHSKPLLNLISLKYSFLSSLRHSLSNEEVSCRVKIETIIKILGYPLSLWAVKKRRLKELKHHYSLVFKHSDRVVLLSDRFRGEMALAHKGDEDKIRAIANINSFEPQVVDLDSKKQQVLFVGRMTYYAKRADRLLSVWQMIQERNPDWELIFVGGGEELEKLVRQAEKSKIERVKFLGCQSNTAPYYRDASIFCMTSSFEGFGMVLTEAMTFGCVPMAFDSYESARDIIDHGVNGLLVEPFDIQMYADELEGLMCDADRRRTMALEAQKKALKFSHDVIVEQWKLLLAELIEK